MKYKSDYPRTLKSKKEQVDYRGASRLGEAPYREIRFLLVFFFFFFSLAVLPQRQSCIVGQWHKQLKL